MPAQPADYRSTGAHPERPETCPAGGLCAVCLQPITTAPHEACAAEWRAAEFRLWGNGWIASSLANLTAYEVSTGEHHGPYSAASSGHQGQPRWTNLARLRREREDLAALLAPYGTRRVMPAHFPYNRAQRSRLAMKLLSDRELLADVVRHGFSQFRHTKHGVLWGFREYRIMLPRRDAGGTGNFTGSGSPSHAAARTREWNTLKERMYGDMPGFKDRVERKPSLLPDPQPILQVIDDPLDILRPTADPHLRTGILIPEAREAAILAVRAEAHAEHAPPVQAPPPAQPVALHLTSEPPIVISPTPEPAVMLRDDPAYAPQEEVPMPETTTITEQTIRAALAAAGGNRTIAADGLRISRTTLQHHMARLGITDVPLATSWVCPYCRTEFKAPGKHLDHCPAAKAARRAARKMERDRHEAGVARAANPAFVAPHVRAAAALDAETVFREVGRPRADEPDFAVADRPEAYPRTSHDSPLFAAILKTAETGKAVTLPGFTDGAKVHSLMTRIARPIHLRGLKLHYRRLDGATFVWVERPAKVAAAKRSH